MAATERGEITSAGRAAQMMRDCVVHIAALSRAAAAAERTGPVPDLDQVPQPGRWAVAVRVPDVQAGAVRARRGGQVGDLDMQRPARPGRRPPGAAMPDRTARPVGQREAPAAAGPRGQRGAQCPAGAGVHRAEPGYLARRLCRTQPAGQGHGQIDRPGQPSRSAARGAVRHWLAQQQGEVDPGTELIQRSVHAGLLQAASQGVDALVGGQHVGRGQIPARQGGGARALGPDLDPGVPLRLLPAPARCGWVSLQHGPFQRGA